LVPFTHRLAKQAWRDITARKGDQYAKLGMIDAKNKLLQRLNTSELNLVDLKANWEQFVGKTE